MKAYLDNDVVSAIAKDDNAAEADALDRLLKAYDEGKRRHRLDDAATRLISRR